MSDAISQAVEALNTRLADGFDGSVKFVLEGEGSIMVGPDGAREGDDPADMTMTAEAEVFRDIMEGSLDATAAFMSGKLRVDGDMGLAMRLGSALS